MSRIKDKKIEVREIVYSQDDEKSFGDVFVYEPENIEEQNLGSLFIVGELKELPRNCSYIMNVLASKIKKEFYANTKRSAEESLEAGLAEANKILADLAEQGNGEYVGRLSMVCGTYRNNKFYLSQLGKMKSLLVREGRMMEIVKDEGGKPVSPKRAFNNIASGELSDGDLVIFATEGLFNIFTLERLRQLASSQKVDEFFASLQEAVEEEDSDTVSALLIEIEGEKKKLIEHSAIELQEKETQMREVEPEETAEEENAEKVPIVTAVGSSEAEPVTTAEESLYAALEGNAEDESGQEAVLESSAPEAEITASEKVQELAVEPETREAEPEIEDKTFEASVVAENHEEKPLQTKDPGKVSLSDIIREYEKMESRNLQINVNAEKDKSIEEMIAKKESNNFEDLDEKEEKLHKKVISKAKGALRNIKGDQAKAIASSLGSLKKMAHTRNKEYNVQSAGRMSLRNKKIVIAAILLVLLGSAYVNSQNSKKKEAAAARAASYQAMLDEAKSKMEQSEVESISGSEGAAGSLAVEARDLARRVKDEFDGLDSQADEVIASAQVEIDKIDRVVRVDSPDVVVNLDNGNINNISEANGSYYVIDGQDNAVYKIDEKGSKIDLAAKSDNKVGNLMISSNFQNQEILLSDGMNFLSFNAKSNKMQDLSSKVDSEVKDFTTYGRYVYILSPAQNQIYKYQKSASGLDSESEWIKGGDVKNAVSMAIDQYAYILTSDGHVKKYYTGEEYADKDGNRFDIKQPSDPISAPSKIYTLTDQKYLYITEPSKGRILLFDKTSGSLYKQYIGADLKDLKGLVTDADEKEMLVLSAGKVLKLGIE